MINSIINNLDIIDFARNSGEVDIEIFKNKNYGEIKVYRNEGKPALFLKEVDSFDIETFKVNYKDSTRLLEFSKSFIFICFFLKQK